MKKLLVFAAAAVVLAPLQPDAHAQCGELAVDALTEADVVRLGTAVAMAGDWLFASTFSNPDSIIDGGAVYAYQRQGDGWALRQILTAGDADEHDRFGTSIAADGTRVVVGAPFDQVFFSGAFRDVGAAYVFDLTPSGWTQTQKLVPSDIVGTREFGDQVAVSGDTVAVGVPRFGLNRGIVYVFQSGPAGWLETQMLEGNDTASQDHFGDRLALEDGTLVVGASLHDHGLHASGSVYVFERGPGGLFAEVDEIRRKNPLSSGLFGSDVDVFGDWLLIGARNDGPDGSAYFYRKEGSTWTQFDRVKPDFCAASTSYFGLNVALGDRIASVAALCGNSVFVPHGDEWVAVHPLPDLDNPVVPGPTAIGGRTVAVAESWDSSAGFQAGIVHVVDVPEPTSYCDTTPSSTGATAQLFVNGCASVTADLLELVVTPVPEALGRLLYGSAQTQVPFGDGFLCITGAVFDLPPTSSDAGTLTFAIDYDSLPPGGAMTPGTTWSFQALFRDSTAMGAGFNTSEAREVLFLP